MVPVLPGSLLILVAVLGWAAEEGSRTAWAAAAIAAAILVAGGVVKYVVPGRRLTTAGVPRRSVAFGGLLGIVGFFVVPVLGLFAGFVLGVYLSETQRVGRARAWPSTRATLAAAGLSILIELVAGLLASATWLVAVLD
ncbi:MAG: DUF456 domain-containing protein [Nocardioidaceae bacterium]